MRPKGGRGKEDGTLFAVQKQLANVLNLFLDIQTNLHEVLDGFQDPARAPDAQTCSGVKAASSWYWIRQTRHRNFSTSCGYIKMIQLKQLES